MNSYFEITDLDFREAGKRYRTDFSGCSIRYNKVLMENNLNKGKNYKEYLQEYEERIGRKLNRDYF